MPCHVVHSVSLLKINKGSCILFIILFLVVLVVSHL